MVSVTCPCVECIYNGKRNKCTAKNISLTFRNMATVNEGRVDMWVCNMYEKSEFCKMLEEKFYKCNSDGWGDILRYEIRNRRC